jgi:hypothetical protein
MSEELKSKVVSFAQTFVSSFLVVLSNVVLTTSPEALLNFQAWSFATTISIIFGAVRLALKMSWEKTLPVSLGGKR